MAVIDAQATVFEITDDEATPALQVVGGIKSFSGMDGEASDIDISTLASSAKEYRQGLQDFGNFSVELFRDPDDAGQAEMLDARAKQDTRVFVLTTPSGGTLTTATFSGYVKSMSTDGSVDGVLEGTCNIKITGAVVWS